MKASDFDFNNLDFQRMGGWPTPVKAVFCAVIVIVIVGIGVWWKVLPQRGDLRKKEAQEAELLQQFEYKQGKVVNLEAYRAQLEEMKEVLQQMLRQLPSKTEMPDLLVDVSQTALSTGIDSPEVRARPGTGEGVLRREADLAAHGGHVPSSSARSSAASPRCRAS